MLLCREKRQKAKVAGNFSSSESDLRRAAILATIAADRPCSEGEPRHGSRRLDPRHQP
jgi:hypothetical protein